VTGQGETGLNWKRVGLEWTYRRKSFLWWWRDTITDCPEKL